MSRKFVGRLTMPIKRIGCWQHGQQRVANLRFISGMIGNTAPATASVKKWVALFFDSIVFDIFSLVVRIWFDEINDFSFNFCNLIFKHR